MKYLSAAVALLAITSLQLAAAGPTGPRRGESFVSPSPVSSDAAFSTDAYYQSGEGAESSGLNPGVRLLLGALVPGLPQYLDGRPRAFAYFAVEGAAIGGLVVLNSRGDSYRERYINLARTARANFVYPGLRNNPTEDVDLMAGGYGEYYEDLLKWSSSGDYDDNPDLPGVQPETDPRTYNGHQWEIAQINNYTASSGGMPVPASDAEREAALQAYRSRVYDRELNWDWTGIDADNREYHRLFDRSEDSYRHRSKFTTALVANHIVSVLDVLITERITRSDVMRKAGIDLELRMHAPAGAPPGDVIPLLRVGRAF